MASNPNEEGGTVPIGFEGITPAEVPKNGSDIASRESTDEKSDLLEDAEAGRKRLNTQARVSTYSPYTFPRSYCCQRSTFNVSLIEWYRAYAMCCCIYFTC